MDILFVIDDSGTMIEEQALLVASFPRFVEILENASGGLPNVHLGVVSTDIGAGANDIRFCTGNGDDGILQDSPRPPAGETCQGPADRFIVDLEDPSDPQRRIRNYPDTQTLGETFSCIARLGTEGCAFEMPLEAMYRALHPDNAANQGFLRDDALLAVIIVTDEDDCSTEDSAMFGDPQATLEHPLGPRKSFRCFEFGVDCETDTPRSPGVRNSCVPRKNSQYMFDVDRYVEFLKTRMGKDPRDIVVIGIAGDREPVEVIIKEAAQQDPIEHALLRPSCTVDNGGPKPSEAEPAIRLSYFLDQFPGRNIFMPICTNDLTDTFQLIARELTANPCMRGNIDTDPDREGVQEDCSVADVRSFDGDAREETPIRKCTSTNPAQDDILPCWRLVPDSVCMGDNFPSGLALQVEPQGRQVPAGTVVVASCAIQRSMP